MPKEFLEIQITADNSKAVAELNELGTRLKTFETQIKKATDSEVLIRLQKSINDTKTRMEALNSSINPLVQNTQNFAKGSNQAAQALTNVGRVAQDLPFGFMGIQNNLNPLLESFQRLKAESGSTSGALKAMAGSLMGSGGVGLALSVVSSAFVIYQSGIMGFNKKTAEAKEKLDKFTESLNQNREAASKDLASMRAYVDAAQNTSLSIEQRQTAVDKLIQQYPAYFKGLTVENALTKDLTQSTNALTDAIYKRAAARAMEGDVAAAANEVFREQEKLDALRLNIDKAREDLAKQRKNPTQIGGGGTLGGVSAGVVTGDVLLEKTLNTYLSQQDKLLTSIDQKKQSIALKQLRINALTADTINLDAKYEKPKPEKEIKEKAKAISGPKYNGAKLFEERLSDEIKFFNDSYAIWKENEDKKNAEILRGRKEREQAEQFDIQIMRDSGKVIYDNAQAKNQEAQASAEESRKKRIEEMNTKLMQQKELATGIGNAFQQMFANVANAKDPFEALGNSVKQLVIDLAAAAAKMAIIEGIMTLLFPERAAAKKAGKLLGGIIGGGYAKGGIATGPQGGHMELLHGTEAVLTPAQMSGLVRNSMNAGAIQSMGSNGGQDMNISGEFVARGQDLVLALQRSNYSLNLRRG